MSHATRFYNKVAEIDGGEEKRNDRPLPMTRVAAGVYRVKTADASIGESRIMCV